LLSHAEQKVQNRKVTKISAPELGIYRRKIMEKPHPNALFFKSLRRHLVPGKIGQNHLFGLQLSAKIQEKLISRGFYTDLGLIGKGG
jgi:hypothetical protein